MEPITLTFITRHDCELCTSAHEVVERVLAAVPEHIPVEYQEIDVTQNEQAEAEYGEFLPVVLIAGVQHSTFTVREDKLAQALVKEYRERKQNGGEPRKTGWLTQLVRRAAKKSASN